VGGKGWSERYLYLPIVGLTMIVSDLTDWGMAAVGRRIPGLAGPAGRTAAVLAGTVWVTSLAVLALVQAATWRDTEALAVASVAASPTSAEAWNMLAVHQARRREVEAAEKSFGQAITLAASPLRRADHLANLGRMLLDVGRDADAAKAFAAVVEGVPRHAAGRRGLGVALTRLDATEEAVLIFRGLVAENPRDADAWVGLGNAQYRLGRFGEAVASYGRALAVDPRDPATLINRAWARLDSGDRAGAESDAIAASRLGDPQAADVLATLRSATPVPSFAVPTEGGPGSVP
jgi:Flp pilus assembly protein TadD